MQLIGYTFTHISTIDPQRDSSGQIIKSMPQSRYENRKNLPLNKNGHGPFCQFWFPNNFHIQGVYLITIDDDVVYVGECQNLSERFGARGYGTIAPRNCFVGGQSTNCKINNLILKNSLASKKIDVWFLETPNRKLIESKLIRALQPP